jgi:excisionase family DNA binding protein
MDDYVTTAEAAQIIGYHRDAVSDLVRRGELHGEKIHDRLLLLKRAEVEEFARTRKRGRGRPRKTAALGIQHSQPPAEQPS